MVTDISKAKKGKKYEDAPEDIKGKGEMTEANGTCDYCGQMKMVRIFPGENPDEVATRECECSEARQERELQNKIFAVKKGIDKRLKATDPETKEFLKVGVELVARGKLDSITAKADYVTMKIIDTKRLACVCTKTETEEIDEMDGVEE